MTQDYFMTMLGMDGLLEKEDWEKELYPEETVKTPLLTAEQGETDGGNPEKTERKARRSLQKRRKRKSSRNL